jgi:hypothetical protein
MDGLMDGITRQCFSKAAFHPKEMIEEPIRHPTAKRVLGDPSLVTLSRMFLQTFAPYAAIVGHIRRPR